MRRKGHPHGELSDEEKMFFAKRKASISERRRERLKGKEAQETQKQKR
jgi:hypothetical protein